MSPRLLLLVPTSTYRARAFVQAARRLPVELSIASEVPSALSDLHPVDLPSFDFLRPGEVNSFIASFAADNPIDAVVAVDDQATLAAAMIASTLGLRGNTPESVAVTLNKYRTRIALDRAGLRQPPFRLVPATADPSNPALDLEWPVVVKPLAMAASRGVIRADSPQEFASAFSRVAGIVTADGAPGDDEARGNVLVEGYVPGWEVAVEGIVSRGQLHIVAIFDKPDPLEGPYFPETIYTTPTRLSTPDRMAVETATRNAVAAVGLSDGPVHVELRGGDGEAVIIELAARSIGGLCSKVVRFEGGYTLEDVILQHALGVVSQPPPREAAAAGVMMLQADRRGILESVGGVDQARAVPGVDEVIISTHPGREVSPLPEGFLYLGFIFARARSAEAVEHALRTAHAHLDVVIR